MGKTGKAIQFIHEMERQLRTVYEDPTLCRQYAWWILEEITRCEKEELIAHDIIDLNDTQQQMLDEWLDKLINKKMPLQYLVGAVPFNGIEILVEPPILIPRPETEEWTIQLIKQLKQLPDQDLTILDVGTGSGCIALALANALPHATVYASDISEKALALAQKNAFHNGITNIKFVKGDVFEGLSKDQCFDLIVSNPPYISPDEWEELDNSVTKWEDKNALVADQEGLSIIATIIKDACCFIHENNELKENKIPNLIIEIGYKQANTVSNLMENAHITDIMVEKDLEEKDRVVSGRVSSCGQCHHATPPT